jgi:hypothetical protein
MAAPLSFAPRRELGRTGFQATQIGVRDLADRSLSLEACVASSGGKAAEGVPELPHLTVEECVRYTLTCDPDVALLGMSFPNEQDTALRAAREFQPLSPAELADVRRRATLAMAGKGRTWWNPE